MYVREIGSVVAALLVACMVAPLVLIGMVAGGRLGVQEGLVAAGVLAVMLYLSTQSFLIIWRTSPWTDFKERPRIVGATLLESAGYSLLAFLAGMVLRGWQ